MVVPDETPEELVDLCDTWLVVRDLKFPVDLFPVRRGDFDTMRHHMGSLPFIATHDGTRADGR